MLNIDKELVDKALLNRRHMHQHPELSFQETHTANWISDQLEEMAVKYRRNVGGNGIVATLKQGKADSSIVALRADFDALPILEQSNSSFASVNKGVMHACGHDFHTSILLSVLEHFKQDDAWEGTIHFIFQHAEEMLPGGAIAMLQDNLFDGELPKVIIAQHVDPDLKVGTFGFKPGAYMASSDEIYLTITGRGGHAALPHKINDTVLAASQTIVNLQQIASRKADPTTPMVLSFGKLMALGATNVIPSEVRIEGTLRTFDETWREDSKRLIDEITVYTAKAHGCNANIDIKYGYPVLFNNEAATQTAIDTCKNIFGEHNTIALTHRMTAEDFGYFSQQYPAVFYRCGVAQKDASNNFPLHSSQFNLNEDAIEPSIKMMINLTLKFLNS